MKKLIYALFGLSVALGLGGCEGDRARAKKAEQYETNRQQNTVFDNGVVKVIKLGQHDGCTIYRVEEYYYVYRYVRCGNDTTVEDHVTVGKSTYPRSVPTTVTPKKIVSQCVRDDSGYCIPKYLDGTAPTN